MNTRLSKLLEKLTAAEQAEVANFAAYLLARRSREKLQVLAFDWLDAPDEDVYSLEDGQPVRWPSILKLKGLGKETWQGVDAQEYVDGERDSWHE